MARRRAGCVKHKSRRRQLSDARSEAEAAAAAAAAGAAV